MDAKRQLEQQVAQQQKTREQLNAAQQEVNRLRMQPGSTSLPLSSPSNMSFRGTLIQHQRPTKQQGALMQRQGHKPFICLPNLIY